MQKFQISITGVSPYMQHRMDDRKLIEWERQRGNIIERDNLTDEPEKIAAFHSYINGKGEYYFPSEHFKQSFIKGGGFVKAKIGNANRSMKNIVAGQWRITDLELPFRKFDEVDTRSAVNGNNKARIITHRPKWLFWNQYFTLEIDSENNGKQTTEMITAIINYAGRYIGVGSYRPEHTGEFGRFNLTKIDAI